MNTSVSFLKSEQATLPQKKLSMLFFFTVGWVFLMVILGGVTRLTGSGLSIVNWHPILGILPPLTAQEWDSVFALYKASPEYTEINFWMDLQDFKSIFWLEYIHRLVGCLLGFFFLIPIVYCLIKRDLQPWRGRTLGLWILGGFQGFVGWYMVKSGLVKDPWVSPYRLCLHLLLGFFTCGLLFWYGLTLRSGRGRVSCAKGLKSIWEKGLFVLFILTISYGAFVAGLKAGLLYNTFPLMNGHFIPEDAFYYTPWIKNFFVNPSTVQFTHRILALTTVCCLGLYIYKNYTFDEDFHKKKWLLFLGLVGLAQLSLGIATLVLQVPVFLAALHQGGALVLLLVFLRCIFQEALVLDA